MPETNGNGLVHLDELRDLSAVSQAAEIRAAASVVLDRMQFLNRAGITFKGKRDLYQVLGYERNLTYKEMRDRYLRGGVAGRIVDAFPNATWRGEMWLEEDENPEKETTFEKAWSDLEKRLQVIAKLRRVDVLSGLSTYAVLLIGAPGNLEEELPRGKGNSRLLYLSAFSGGGGPYGDANARAMAQDADCTIETFDDDVKSERFGLPMTYRLKRTSLATPMLQRAVHWSRIIHVAESCLFDEVYGQPRLQRVWNLLDDLDKVTGGGAEAFWLRANQGIQLNVDKQMQLSEANKSVADLKQQAEEYSNGMTRWLRTRGVDINTLGSDVANLGDPADTILTQIAGALSIPKRVLTGSEMGELASSQDRDNWKDQINGRQASHAGPYIVRQLVNRLIDYGYLPTPSKGPMEYEVKWPHIEVLTEQEKAEGAARWAQTNATMGMTVFTEEEIRDHWYGMQPAEESDQELYRATLALRMAMTNKTQGLTVITPEEIRKTCYGWEPLKPEQAVPIASPLTGGKTDGKTDEKGIEKAVLSTPASKPAFGRAAAEAEAEDEELLRVLTAAIETNNVAVIDSILGIRHAWGYHPEQPRDDEGKWTAYEISYSDAAKKERYERRQENIAKANTNLTQVSDKQRAKLLNAFVTVSNFLDDPSIGQEVWSYLSSFTPESLERTIKDLREGKPYAMIGGGPPKPLERRIDSLRYSPTQYKSGKVPDEYLREREELIKQRAAADNRVDEVVEKIIRLAAKYPEIEQALLEAVRTDEPQISFIRGADKLDGVGLGMRDAEAVGHEFHGNQYTSGKASAKKKSDEFLHSPSDALIELINGKPATVAPEDVRHVLMKATEHKAPVDLTKLTIEGTPIFAGGLNRPRLTMPQIPDEHRAGFIAHLKEQGIQVKDEHAAPAKLLPTQNEINAGKVGHMLAKNEAGKTDLQPIFVSKDNYVLDGHHRWAVGATLDAENPKASIKMPVTRIMAPHDKALKAMEHYADKHKIAHRALLFNEDIED